MPTRGGWPRKCFLEPIDDHWLMDKIGSRIQLLKGYDFMIKQTNNLSNIEAGREPYNSSQNAIVGDDWLIPIAPQLLSDLQSSGFDENQIKDYAHHAQVAGHLAMKSAGLLSNKESLDRIFEDNGKLLNRELTTSLSSIVENLQQVIDVSKEEDKVHLVKTRETLDSFLIQLTSEDRTSSIPNLVEAKVSECIEVLLNNSLNPNVAGSMAENLLTAHRKDLASVQKLLVEMNVERKEEFERYRDILGINKHIEELASKPKQEDGLIFEDRVSEEIAIVSGVFSDVVLATGNDTLGVGQSKSGDTLVQIKDGHTEQAKISIESKSGRFSMTGKNSLSVQLEQAMANHNSDLGLAIVDASKAPKSLLKKMYLRLGENTHVVVVDIKNDDFQVLNLYYAILRELAIHERNRKTSGQEAAKIDSDHVVQICEKSIVELTKLNAVKRNLRNSVAKGALDSASLIEIQQSEMIDSFRKIIREVKKGDTK